MASASAAPPIAPGTITGTPAAGAPIVARRRLPANASGSVVATADSGAPTMYPGKLAPKLPWPDIGYLARWSVSSFKFGFGAECLTDDDPDTFWHSDGPQPHFVTIEFPRKVAVQKISMYLSFALDDSYTPATLAVRAGTGPIDMQDIRFLTIEKPDGWVTFDVCIEPNDDGEGFKAVDAYVIQVVILANHMHGKDTHVRGLKILGPLERKLRAHEELFPFTNPEFKMFECIR
ncbi:APC10-domain-containing protein [Epithele typhae]|uniref:APC10-domain-containing protein n=1 Tax=Epithele typhae TaxID=378194 RepID=UPI002007991F|nr:APC10-domain-containing protein [Epithele typhae]KAH9933669.1 APC10-domain-containing protein [Epithele typhae]